MITNIYMLVCIGLFIYIRFIESTKDFSHTALKLGAMYPPKIHEKKEYWRILTCHFIHIDPIHLFMNMYCIYYLGHFFESMMGTLQYGILVFSSMICSGLITYFASYYSDHAMHTLTLGASGVFYGYLGAVIGLALFRGGNFVSLLQNYLFMIVINLGFTLFAPGISKSGHLGGLLGGYLYIFVITQFF
ncbi:rhomboid family intramembrane serine protease [Eggerthia catenaformis]|uniref:rhomboid family intramembrane serine protease n=1 Tax=Eggerthia catenaformis TaxID=31973 RepID=UPI0028EAF09F|nr:rhomboid family intramembrane serine protease [Eggerthia catenaformis]